MAYSFMYLCIWVYKMGLQGKSEGAVKFLLVTAALFVVLAGIKTAATLLVPFLLSAFIAIICNPLVVMAARYKIPKPIAVVLVIGIFVSIALSLSGLVGNSLNKLSQLIPVYRAQLQEQFIWLTQQLDDYNIIISSELLIEYFDPAAAMGLAANMLSGLGGVMANLFLIIITVVFMLFEASSIPHKL
ncbi:MAG: AI-2 transport protein TqsA, partial [Psychroserpens sp.]